MNYFVIRKHTLQKFLGLIFSIAYGFFSVAYLNNHFSLDSGDIMSIVRNANEYESWNIILSVYGSAANILLNGDAIFHGIVLLLKNLLNVSSQAVLGIYAFLTSSITFFILSLNIRQRKYLFFITLLFLMVFFTPRVMNLFSSSIRSGIAFTILIISFVYLKGLKQYIFLLLSTIIHLSMAPMIAFYVLFNWIEKKRIKLSFAATLFLLLLCTTLISVIVPKLTFTYDTGVNQSLLYMVLITIIALLMIFTNKSAIKNVYGFISIGLILVVLTGYYLVDFSFVRYIGNAIIFYLLFIVKEGTPRTLHVFTVGYMPFFLVTLYYSIANYW